MKAQLRLGALAHGGEAVARHEGRVVFVRGAAPGDLVEAELSGDGRFEHARALRVLERGAEHVEAPCAIVDACGGCPVQRVEYGAQLHAKRELTADALERIGGFARDSYELGGMVASPRQLRYRRRARLHRVTGAGTPAWGFAQHGSAGIAPVHECLLFEPALQALADAVRAVDLSGATDLALLSREQGGGAVDVRGKLSRARLDALLAVKGVRGVTHDGQIHGDPVIADLPLPNGARLRARPDTFAQANRAAVPLLQAEVTRALGGARNVLELFCGAGTLTLPLLPARSVLGVESAGPSLKLLRKSADEAGLALRLIEGDAAKVVRGLGRDERFDAALLDPPRTGAADAVRALAALAPARLVYVSCDAPTLARDGKLLAAAGYRLARAVPLDLFPQTAHFEVVATFERVR